MRNVFAIRFVSGDVLMFDTEKYVLDKRSDDLYFVREVGTRKDLFEIPKTAVKYIEYKSTR